MQVPLLDLKLQYQSLRENIRAELLDVAESQQFILGAKVEAFESAIATYSGANFAVGASSGTDALLMILMALGIGPGDMVITTPYTFFATAGCVARVGATPVFVDINPSTYNMSPAALQACLKKNDTKKIKAIMPVHLFGLVAAMDEICELAGGLSIPVIEDAAQALGADYPSRRRGILHAGAIGEFGYFSFFPSKNLGAFGDAGMAMCRDETMAMKMKSLRNHGMEQRYFHKMIGGNFRLDALQAAILQIKLPHLDEWSAARRANARFYREEFARAGLDSVLTLPTEPYAASGAPNHHIYNQFVIRAPRRDDLCEHLLRNQIGHAIYYPVALHLQDCFASLGYREGDFPESERAARETLALPIFPELTREQQSFVVETIRAFYA
jgi:dTDP-4-amino-4,6-dideoxygalactose transaminase